MTSAGLLRVHAGVLDGRFAAIEVDLRRPPVTRLFIGQPPEAVVKTVPYLFTLCAHAQRAAAQAALAAAANTERRPVDNLELWIEFLHENFWRLLLDWPAALGLPPAREAFVAWRSARTGEQAVQASRALLEETLLPLAEKWREMRVDRRILPTTALPPLNPDEWLNFWMGRSNDAPQARRPASIDSARETRLHEVMLAIDALQSGTPYPIASAGKDGWGVGQTLTARGVLTHAVHLQDDHVRNYRVWAPTDCHFANADGLVELLDDLQPADSADARRLVEQAVLALDPCLPFTVELTHA
jgi:hypothetical protein